MNKDNSPRYIGTSDVELLEDKRVYDRNTLIYNK